jgi:hypothetical protein
MPIITFTEHDLNSELDKLLDIIDNTRDEFIDSIDHSDDDIDALSALRNAITAYHDARARI